MEMNLCVMVKISDRWSLNHTILHSGDIGCMGMPVLVYIVRLEGWRAIYQASFLLRVSAQVIALYNGLPDTSTGKRLCMAALKPIPFIVSCPGTCPMASLVTLSTAWNMISG